ncbi:unnamed protein product [Aphanomyces euteiches]|nr:hypothetical protein Ae201684P_008934 [Aphanomyces euteiches]
MLAPSRLLQRTLQRCRAKAPSIHRGTWIEPSRLLSQQHHHHTPQKRERDPNDKLLQIATIPNAITMTRIAFTPYLGYLILQGDYKWAVAVLSVASVSDWLDGYLARRLNQKTIVGTFLDPLADKVMVGTLCLSLGYVDLLPLPLIVLIFGRDLLLIGGTLLYRYRTKTAQSDFFQTNNVFEVEPTWTSKINTALQFATLGGSLINAAFPLPGGDLALQSMFAAVSVSTFASGWGYLTAWRNREGMFRHLPK